MEQRARKVDCPVALPANVWKALQDYCVRRACDSVTAVLVGMVRRACQVLRLRAWERARVSLDGQGVIVVSILTSARVLHVPMVVDVCSFLLAKAGCVCVGRGSLV
jgi:hypothetical protein